MSVSRLITTKTALDRSKKCSEVHSLSEALRVRRISGENSR